MAVYTYTYSICQLQLNDWSICRCFLLVDRLPEMTSMAHGREQDHGRQERCKSPLPGEPQRSGAAYPAPGSAPARPGAEKIPAG